MPGTQTGTEDMLPPSLCTCGTETAAQQITAGILGETVGLPTTKLMSDSSLDLSAQQRAWPRVNT